jgi:transposase
MQVIHHRCAGLDVHKKTVVACVLVTQPDGTARPEVRTFGTMTADLTALSAWLDERRVERVVLESTGVFWWPVFTLLEEGGHDVVLVNPQHVKAVPGRKTDVADSAWLADLLRHGLLRASFIPPAPIRELRDLLRYRKTLVRERAQEVNRLQKVLESANLKLAAVATDVLGVSGRQMLEAVARGEDEPEGLADLARGRLRAKLPQLRLALEGRVKAHHRVLLRALLAHVDFLEAALEALDAEVERALVPFAPELALLETIPGVGRTAAAALVAELGADLRAFPSAKHLASWAGVCPGNRQSGGRRLSGKTTHGNGWLRGVLGEIAWAAIRTRGSSFGARFRRLARRQGKPKALVAVMHNLLTVIYAVVRDGTPYHELGPDYFITQDPERAARRHVAQLERLGYRVALSPAAAA